MRAAPRWHIAALKTIRRAQRQNMSQSLQLAERSVGGLAEDSKAPYRSELSLPPPPWAATVSEVPKAGAYQVDASDGNVPEVSVRSVFGEVQGRFREGSGNVPEVSVRSVSELSSEVSVAELSIEPSVAELSDQSAGAGSQPSANRPDTPRWARASPQPDALPPTSLLPPSATPQPACIRNARALPTGTQPAPRALPLPRILLQTPSQRRQRRRARRKGKSATFQTKPHTFARTRSPSSSTAG